MSVQVIGTVVNETLIVDGVVDPNTGILIAKGVPSVYKTRMTNYYPQVLSAIAEFKAIIGAEYPEFEAFNGAKNTVMDDAYLLTMSERRIEQWEQALGIKPVENSTVGDRRDTIIARIRGQGKLNTTLINSIVNAFTGGSANSWIENSTLYVEVTPPPENKQYNFANVEQEILKKIPAHLGLQIRRNYYTWENVKNTFETWQDVLNKGVWSDVFLLVPFERSV